MSIGKSSIKRAANNGYSNVKSTAPDMENSVVVEEKAPVVEAPVEVTPVVVEKPAEAAKAPAKAKKPAAKKPVAKKACAPKSAGKKPEKAVRLGDDMPYYLL
jgi:hypothetical protein